MLQVTGISVFVAVCSLVCNAEGMKFLSVATAHDHLVTDLFTNYNEHVRPVSKANKTLMVDVSVELEHFKFRETDGAFTFIGVLNVKWADDKLKWNPDDYKNLTKMAVNPRLLWIPDLEFYNTAPDKLLRMHRNGGVVLSSDGSLLWSDDIEVVVFCTPNMLHWPHDHHICNLTLGSWTHHGLEINMRIDENAALKISNETSDLYDVVHYHASHVSTKYESVEEEYVSIVYEIELMRADGNAVLLRIPALVVMMLTLFALLLEPFKGQKIWLYGLCLILITFQLMYFANKTGQFARSTPLIVTFFSCCFVMVTFAIVLSVFCLWLTHASNAFQPLPQRISVCLKNPFTNFLMPSKGAGNMNGTTVRYENTDFSGQFDEARSNDCSELLSNAGAFGERLYLAKALERIFLISYSFIFVIMFSICYV